MKTRIHTLPPFWKSIFLVLLCFAFLVPEKAYSVVNPEMILWRSNDYGQFINSAFQGVLGRNPYAQEFTAWQALGSATKENKANLFWSLVNSSEYRAMFGDQRREYWVYWDSKTLDTDRGVRFCNCYHFSKDTYVYMPTMQYIGINCPSGPFTFGVAAAVRYMYANFDPNTCSLYNCGYQGGSSSENDVATTGRSYEDCLYQYCPDCRPSISLLDVSADPNCESCKEQYREQINDCMRGSSGVEENLISDPNFASFGSFQSKWAHGNQAWWNSGNNQSSASMVRLDANSQPTPAIQTALMIQNYSGRGPHVYGTTVQKVRVSRGKQYTIKLWAAADRLASNSGVLISIDSQWRTRPIRLKAGTYGWTEFSGTFTATEDYAYIRIIAEDSGTTYITGIRLTETYL